MTAEQALRKSIEHWIEDNLEPLLKGEGFLNFNRAALKCSLCTRIDKNANELPCKVTEEECILDDYGFGCLEHTSPYKATGPPATSGDIWAMIEVMLYIYMSEYGKFPKLKVCGEVIT